MRRSRRPARRRSPSRLRTHRPVWRVGSSRNSTLGATVGNVEIFGDALLDNLTLYWITETIGSSMRLYYESRRWPQPFAASDFVQVPTSVFVLPGDLEQPPPREWAERLYNVERYVVAERGGHFPALEIPQIYCAELQAAFHNVVASA